MHKFPVSPGLFVGVLAATSLSAQEVWVTPGNGDYDNVSNWTSQVPDSSTDVIFNQNSAYTVTVPATGSWVAGTLAVEQGDVTFDLSGNGYEVGPPSIAGPTLFIGTSVLNPATLSLTQGNWTMQANAGFDLGVVAGSEGTLNITSADASFTAGSGFSAIGVDGAGTLNVTNGGSFTIGNATVLGENLGSSGTAIVDGPGSSIDGSNYLEVGNAGQAYLAVQNGATFTPKSLRMGDLAGVGTADITGAGSLVEVSTSLVANFGTATLNIVDGGKVATGTITLSWNSGNGTVNVNTDGVLESNEVNLTRGHAGTALLHIEAGGRVDAYSSLTLGRWRVQSGEVSVNEGGTLHIDGGILQVHDLYMDGSTGFGGAGAFLLDAGKLVVDNFYGDLVQAGGVLTPGEGELAPGGSPGRVSVTGNYAQQAGSKLILEFAGAATNSDYDRLVAGGSSTLGGSLKVKFRDDFLPVPGDSFDVVTADVISGDFAGYQLPDLADGAGWNTRLLVDQLGAADVLRLTVENVVLDFDPWSALNQIRPKSSDIFTVMIKTTSIAAGDAYDFDAATVEAASLRAGPDGAANIAVPLTADYDEDGDTDYIFAFNVTDSGLTCMDNMITVTGQDTGGNPIGGSDVIVPIECEEPIVVDVDPWNPENEVRPNDSYTVPVAIMSTSVADGEPADIDATQIDPATLKFGPNQTPHTGPIITTDLDSDTDVDVVFGFNAFDSGIACGDTELVVEGNLYSTEPLLGMDGITTTDCEIGSCHP